MNRDEAAFRPTPSTPTAAAQHTTSPCAGIHSCLGAQLARMEMVTALTTLATKLPGLKLAAEAHLAPLYHR